MSHEIRLRQATFEDARRLWEWRNEAGTRLASFNTSPIPYEDHLRWFRQKIREKNARFIIAVDGDNRDIGYARLDLSGEVAEINLSLDENYRRKGLGPVFIRALVDYAIDGLKARRVMARIKLSNAASASAFRKSGFQDAGTRIMTSCEYTEMIYERVASPPH